MLKLLVRRLGAGAVTLLFVSVAVFSLIELLPGDPAEELAGENNTPEVVARIRTELQLDDPVPVRSVRFVSHAATGDLGESAKLRPGVNVFRCIVDALPPTLSLLTVTLFLAFAIALPLGYLAGSRPGSLIDRGT